MKKMKRQKRDKEEDGWSWAHNEHGRSVTMPTIMREEAAKARLEIDLLDKYERMFHFLLCLIHIVFLENKAYTLLVTN